MAMNRLGFHYYPDDRHYTEKDLSAWLPALSALGAGWLTLRGSAARAVPEPFVRGLLEAGITPIISLPLRLATDPASGDLAAFWKPTPTGVCGTSSSAIARTRAGSGSRPSGAVPPSSNATSIA